MSRQQDKLETWGAFFKELFFCLLHQLWPIHIVSRSQFSVMRASFYLTHRIEQGTSFDFMSYLIESMEEDFGKIVGLGLAMWVFMIVFILMSTAVGRQLPTQGMQRWTLGKGQCQIVSLSMSVYHTVDRGPLHLIPGFPMPTNAIFSGFSVHWKVSAVVPVYFVACWTPASEALKI